jgi:hypothetical protein
MIDELINKIPSEGIYIAIGAGTMLLFVLIYTGWRRIRFIKKYPNFAKLLQGMNYDLINANKKMQRLYAFVREEANK